LKTLARNCMKPLGGRNMFSKKDNQAGGNPPNGPTPDELRQRLLDRIGVGKNFVRLENIDTETQMGIEHLEATGRLVWSRDRLAIRYRAPEDG
jgi:hypothetical protein